MLVYLAGPMRGHDLYNFPLFAKAARCLRAKDYRVLSPAEHDIEAGFDPSKSVESQVDILSIAQMFEWDFQAIVRADAIVFLPGWRDSFGSRIERAVATQLGKEQLEIVWSDDRCSIERLDAIEPSKFRVKFEDDERVDA